MKLQVIATGSTGNCYLLQGFKQSILLDCGGSWKNILKLFSEEIPPISHCLVTHEHMDHCACVDDLHNSGVDIVMSDGTCDNLRLKKMCLSYDPKIISYGKTYHIGEFYFTPIKSVHDAKEPVNYLIHNDGVNILYITDTAACLAYIPNVDHYIIEANYSEEKLLSGIYDESMNAYLAGRIATNHLSITDAIGIIKSNGTKKLKSITFVHLSARNSDAGLFKALAQKEFGVNVNIAVPGLETYLI